MQKLFGYPTTAITYLLRRLGTIEQNKEIIHKYQWNFAKRIFESAENRVVTENFKNYYFMLPGDVLVSLLLINTLLYT